MDLSELTAAPRAIRLGGREYHAAPFTLADWGKLTAWLKDHTLSPVAMLKSDELAGLTDAHRQELFRQALDKARAWPPRAGSPAWFEALETADGGATYFLFLLLSRMHPEIDLAAASAIEKSLSPEEGAEAVLRGLGVDRDPKANGPGSPGRSGTRSRSPRKKTIGRRNSIS